MKSYPFSVTAPVINGKAKLSPQEQESIARAIRQYEGKDVMLIVDAPKNPRSDRQNRYMFGVVYDLIADFTGYTKSDVHEYFKSKFLAKKRITIGGKGRNIAASTTDLSTVEFEEYLRDIREFAQEKMELYIPLPNECGFDIPMSH